MVLVMLAGCVPFLSFWVERRVSPGRSSRGSRVPPSSLGRVSDAPSTEPAMSHHDDSDHVVVEGG